jgi:hypothetical protein
MVTTIKTHFKIWKSVFLSTQSKITKDVFTEMATKQYESRNIDFLENVRLYESALCKVVDLDSIIVVSEAELMMNFAASGFDDTTADWKYFWFTCRSNKN